MNKTWKSVIDFFKSSTWFKLRKLLIWNGVVSVIVSGIIWKLVFWKDFNLHFAPIEIDFFNTIGVVFTIIGFGIALFQIAELQSRQEVIDNTTKAIKKQQFKLIAYSNCLKCKEILEQLQRKINIPDPLTHDNLNDFINDLNQVLSTLLSTNSLQNTSLADHLIDCRNCITLLKEVRDNTYEVIERKAFPSFPKQRTNDKIERIIENLIEHENLLKSEANVTG